jgi:hypothetical protein
MKAVLDAGTLIAVDRRDRGFGAMLRVLQRQGTPLRASAAAVAQVWRDGPRQANLARVLTGVGIASLAAGDSKRVGELLATARMADVVDAHVALLVGPGDMLFTGDPEDLNALTDARGISANVLAV